MVIEEILSPTILATECISLGYCETSDFLFLLIFSVSSSPSLTTCDSYVPHR